jgi:hypothetical protein
MESRAWPDPRYWLMIVQAEQRVQAGMDCPWGESTIGVLAHQRPRDRKISRILFLNKVKADAAVL